MLIEQLALVAGGLFAGGALFVSVVDHPGWLADEPARAQVAFARVYPRAAALQGGLAVLAAVLATIAWRSGNGSGFGLAALAFGAVVLFTLAAFKPALAPLLGKAEAGCVDAEAVGTALRRFGWLHAVRVVLGLSGFAMLVRAVAI